jgi:3-deoxy-D-manno-octulosonate 8-phosphate phosphatase (KDO 8-P phosphatase)
MTFSAMNDTNLGKRIKQIKWLLCDVDGVLTDGGVYLIGPFFEAKRFNIQDGMGITLARRAGLKVGFITGRKSFAVKRRAKELHIDYLSQGEPNKEKSLDMFLRQAQVATEEIAYIGDDIQDIPILKRVGLPIAVQNARREVKDICLYVTSAEGGHGAVREVVEWILEGRKQGESVFLSPFGN